ncbi:MAG: peptidoglycan-binding protein [Acidobacteriia bacterium]|nr:peptidoglycan-binding protein [Terriglobia bacterium]
MSCLKLGSKGSEVSELQLNLRERGFTPADAEGWFGPATQQAVRDFQRSVDLTADGTVGPRTALALGLSSEPEIAPVIPGVTLNAVARMFPLTPIPNIRQNLPAVLRALLAHSLGDRNMVLMSLATIRAESESFRPLSEDASAFNTSPGGAPFDRYDRRLGNQGPPDGERFRGRGFIQLTGRANYLAHGRAIGLDTQLVDGPERANDPEIAARVLASFLKAKEIAIRDALRANDLASARRLVNGGVNGLDRFEDAYRRGDALLPPAAAQTV